MSEVGILSKNNSPSKCVGTINSVMKDTPKTLHKEHCELIEDKPNLCASCGQSLKQIGNINKHNTVCKILNSKKYKKLHEDDDS